MAPPERPSAEQLRALGTDDWAAVVAVAMPVLRELPPLLVDAAVKRLTSVPPGRLMGGRSRRDLTTVLVRPAVWTAVAAAWPADRDRPWEAPQPPPADPRAEDLQATVARLEQQVAELRERDGRRAERLATLRGERDAARREADGAAARATTAEAAAAAARDAERELEQQLAAAHTRLAAADEEQRRAVERVERRQGAADRRLEDRLTAVRRERDELRAALEATRARAERAEAAAAAAPAVPAPSTPATGRGRRGRPSVLPDGVAPGTRDAAAWLVGEGRALLVDGYNVTRTHRAHLDLPAQRRWLEQAVAALARRRHVDATVVWDSTVGAPSTVRPAPNITVRFTEAELSADDELVLHVQTLLAPDEPVVVVTDDRELRDRLAVHGVDLLDSRSFTWLL